MCEYATFDFTNHSCFVCFIMYHGGKEGQITCYKLNEVYVKEFIDPIKENKTLNDKPKIFFIQAYRDTETMLQSDKSDDDAKGDLMQVQIEDDIIYCNSAIEGFY